MSNELAYELENLMDSMAPMVLANNFYGLLGLAGYVLSAIALYTMGSRRGINHAWLSWIPIGNLWILGSLADQYRYVSREEVKNKRKAMLILSLVQIPLLLVVSVVIGGSILRMIGLITGGYMEDYILETMMGSVIGVIAVCFLEFCLAIATMVIRYMALYDVYRSCAPENGVLFLVISIFFKVTIPFFLFFTRKRDNGMVRQPAGAAYANPSYQVFHAAGSSEDPDLNRAAPQEAPPETQCNPEGCPEPWTENPEDQDPWNQGPEQL